MKAIWDFLEKTQRLMKVIGAICLAGMVAMTCTDVIMREFGRPIFGTEEIVTFLLALVVSFSLPFSHQEKIHVGVEILVRLLKPRTRAIIKLCTDTVTLALMITITITLFYFAQDTHKSGEVSMNLELPEYMIIYAMAFCFFILNFFVLKDIVLFFTKDKGNS